MAKNNNNTSEIDVTTLTENLKAVQLENKTLHEQQAELNNSLSEKDKIINEQNEKIKALNLSLEQISNDKQQLQNQITQNDNNAEQNNNTIAELQQQVTEAKQKEEAAKEELNNLRIQFNDFVKQKEEAADTAKTTIYEEKPRTIQLTPFAFKLLRCLSTKLTEKYGRTIKPAHIIEDYLIRYNIQRWSEWFHPFILTDNEILNIAQEIKPDIKSLRQLKETLKIRNNED